MKLFPVTAILLLTFMSCLGLRDRDRNNDEDNADFGSNEASVCDTHTGVCQNYHESEVDELNSQITRELEASYVYEAMAVYFARHDVALHGFAKKFREMSNEERTHAQMMMDYQTKRGGTVTFNTIKSPPRQKWKSALGALKDCLKLEHEVNAHLLRIHDVAQTRNDPHLQDYLEGTFLTEQVDAIKELADLITKLESFKRDGNLALGTHMMDKEL